MFGFSYLKLGLGLGALILIGLAAFALKAMVNKIDKQGQQIATLRGELATEREARKRDVAGLTTLTRGIVAASSARALDEEVLRETIDNRNPQPVSPDLGAFLDGLRGQGRAPEPDKAPGGAGGPPPRGARHRRRKQFVHGRPLHRRSSGLRLRGARAL
jgi:hypothetical protein